MSPALESPAALALALTVPAIVALWVLRPRRPRRRVPSVMLWPASPAERQSARPWQRLRNHPLLWLQIAAALALALAAARPFLPADPAGRHLVVLLDASGSMRATEPDAPERFAVAKERVIGLAEGLGPDQELTLIRVDAEPRALLTASHDRAAVAAALGPEEAGLGPADFGAALELATALSPGPAEWVLVGDGGLDPGDARRPAGVAFRQIVVGRPVGNVAVTGLVARADGPSTSLGRGPSAPSRPGATVALQAGLRNAGSEPVAGRLQLLAAPIGAEPQLIGAREWRLEPHAETHVTWTGLPAGAGRFEVRLSGVPPTANALASDDRAWAALGAPAEATVLLVGPGNTFLERALGVVGGLRAFRAAPGDWQTLAGAGGSGDAYPLNVLDRLWPEARPSGNALYVGPPVGPELRPSQLWPKADHPLLRHVDWSEVRVGRARPVPTDALGGGWETVVDSDAGPLLVVRQEGGRREALIAFELGQSDLPLRPAFPVLIANLLEWLLPRGEGAPQTVAPGAAARIEPAPLAAEVWVEAADGRRETLAPPWPPRPFRPAEPGLYRVGQVGAGTQQVSDLIAEGYHPAEADLTPRQLTVPAADGAAAGSAQGTRVLWPLLAVALLALGLVEWWVDARGR